MCQLLMSTCRHQAQMTALLLARHPNRDHKLHGLCPRRSATPASTVRMLRMSICRDRNWSRVQRGQNSRLQTATTVLQSQKWRVLKEYWSRPHLARVSSQLVALNRPSLVVIKWMKCWKVMIDLVDPNLLAPAAEVQQISRIPTAVAAEAPWITERRAEAATLAEDCHGTAATAPWTARTPAPAWSGSCLSGPPSLSTTTSTIMVSKIHFYIRISKYFQYILSYV